MTTPATLALTWLPLDTAIVVVGALGAMACALLGVFLLLRQMSMMGDAISHAVLPGLALAFLLTGERDSWTMLVGAALVGWLTTVFTEWIHRAGRVDPGAAMGVVFTVLFALGLILIVRAADHVDLDPGCVLYGGIEYVGLDTFSILGVETPRAALMVGGVLLLNLLFVALCYKELKISTFDPALATTVGINARWMNYLLMTLVAVTTVAAFESVGSVLVIAMLIVPPAAAHLLTDRLGVMILLSLGLAALSAGLGHVAAITLPSRLGFAGESTSTAGMMALVAGLLFAAAFLLAPRHGVLSRFVHRAALSLRIAREDLLGLLYRLEEFGAARSAAAPALLHRAGAAGPLLSRVALLRLRRDGSVATTPDGLRLTERGRRAAQELVRSHRLWETYLEKHLALPASHLHAPAETLEHITDASLRQRLAESIGDPERDPHGAVIPGEAPPARRDS